MPQSNIPDYCYGCHKSKDEVIINKGSGYCKPCQSNYSLWQHRKRKYGINKYQFRLMIEEQGFKCKICSSDITDRSANVDHCHVTSKVRGLLCGMCNTGLGKFKDDTNLLLKAINYLNDV